LRFERSFWFHDLFAESQFPAPMHPDSRQVVAISLSVAPAPAQALASPFSLGWKHPCSSSRSRVPCAGRRERSSIATPFQFSADTLSLRCVKRPDETARRYLVLAGGAAAGSVAAVLPLRMSTAAGGSGLSALASSRLTCHICVSVRTSLKDGMPVSRMPLDTFQ